MRDKGYFYISLGAIACTTFLLLGQVAAAYAIARWSVIALIVLLLGFLAVGGGTSSWLAMFIGKDEEFTKQQGIVALVPVIAAIAILAALSLFGAFAIGG